jgi:hypothetical protein
MDKFLLPGSAGTPFRIPFSFSYYLFNERIENRKGKSRACGDKSPPLFGHLVITKKKFVIVRTPLIDASDKKNHINKNFKSPAIKIRSRL